MPLNPVIHLFHGTPEQYVDKPQVKTACGIEVHPHFITQEITFVECVRCQRSKVYKQRVKARNDVIETGRVLAELS